MSNFFHGKMFAKISELDESFGPYDSLNLTDEFVVVNDNITKKITGLNLTESIVSIGNLASKAYVDAVVDGAPELLNTLNEIAAALNDDSNFASNIISSINTKLPTANFGLEFWSALEGVTTFNIVEDTNLYYTQARFDAALAAKTTTALVEGDNLYFTEQRVLDAMSSQPADRLISGGFEAVLDGDILTVPGSVIFAGGSIGAYDGEGNNGLTLQGNIDTGVYVRTYTVDLSGGEPAYSEKVWEFGVDGTLTLPADPTSLLHAATKGYVDSQINTIESDRLTNGSFEAVLQSDGTLVLPVSPTSDNHAATKGYVDNQVDTVVAGQGFATLGYVEDAIGDALDNYKSDRLVSGSKEVVLQSNGYIRLVNGAQLYDYESGTGNGYGITDAANGTYIGYDPSDTLGALHMDSYTGGNIRIRTTTLPNTYKDWLFESNGALTLPAVPTSANHAATKGYVDDAIVAAELDGGEF